MSEVKMKKFLIFVLLFIIIVLNAITNYFFLVKECRDAYSRGYFVGYLDKVEGKICRVGNYVDEKTYTWVGVGNENYSDIQKDITKRGKGYWWAE